jgi:ABC-2 type transport system ATP-binding protein
MRGCLLKAERLNSMTDSSPALRVEHLAKIYAVGFFRKKVRAISDVTLHVERGEIFGLLGPNGAGKTTTLKVLMGLIRPSAGAAELLGRPVGDLGAKRLLGYLPENPYFYDYLSGRELLVFMGKLFGLGRGEARKRADALLEQVGLTRAADLALRRYSKGMLQRVGLAQALINDPELVILDEPLTGLDPLGRKDVRELIARLRGQRKTVVFSSHILPDVELLADRVAIIVRGRTVSVGPLHELVDARTISTEVVFGQPSAELAAALKTAGHELSRIGETAQVVVQGDASVGPLIDLIRSHGAPVLMVTPRKESLEDVVVRQARAGEQDQAG